MRKNSFFKEPQPGFRAGGRLHRTGTFCERGVDIGGVSIRIGGMMPVLLLGCLCGIPELKHRYERSQTQRLFKYAIKSSSSFAEKIRSYAGIPSPPFMILRRILRSFAGAPLASSRL